MAQAPFAAWFTIPSIARGEYYQAPPLSTVSGPLLDYAVAQGLGFIPLRGERDQEHQFGSRPRCAGGHQRARN